MWGPGVSESGTGALCVCRRFVFGPGALSGPSAFCVGPRRSLFSPGALCVRPRGSVSGPGALCVGPRRCIMFSLQTCTALQVCFLATEVSDLNVDVSAQVSKTYRYLVLKYFFAAKLSGLCRSRMPLIQPPAPGSEARASDTLQAPVYPAPAPCATNPSSESACHPATTRAPAQITHPAPRSLIPGENPKPYCLGKIGYPIHHMRIP